MKVLVAVRVMYYDVWFGYKQGGDGNQTSLRRNLQGRKIRSNGMGIRGMSVERRA